MKTKMITRRRLRKPSVDDLEFRCIKRRLSPPCPPPSFLPPHPFLSFPHLLLVRIVLALHHFASPSHLITPLSFARGTAINSVHYHQRTASTWLLASTVSPGCASPCQQSRVFGSEPLLRTYASSRLSMLPNKRVLDTFLRCLRYNPIPYSLASLLSPPHAFSREINNHGLTGDKLL